MPPTKVEKFDARELQNIADILANSNKVIVVTGAGVSTSCDIPDFRSQDGLYSMVQDDYEVAASTTSSAPTPSQGNLATPAQDGEPPSSQGSASSTPRRKQAMPAMKGQDLFDANLFKNPFSTSIFYKFITKLRQKIQGVKATSPTHKFIRTLRDGGRLIRCYTQNIDGLEDRDGFCSDLSRGKGNRNRFLKRVLEKPRPSTPIGAGDECDGGCEVVQLHGDLKELRCSLCMKLASWTEDGREELLLSGEALRCDKCDSKNEDRKTRGKRKTAVGVLRPNIVLYGEEHPQNQLLAPITEHDLRLQPDTLLIMGTSLKVHGLKNLVKEFGRAVHARGKGKGKVIFVNRTKPSDAIWNDVIDYYVEMDTDDWVSDLRQRREDLWLRQGELQVQVTKKKAPKRKADEADLNEEPESAKKARKVVKEGAGIEEKAPGTSKQKRKADDADLDSESKVVPVTPKKLSERPTKKPRTTSKPDTAPVLSLAPSSQPEGLLTPPPSREEPLKRKGFGRDLPDVETPPLKKQRLKLRPPKLPVWKDGEGTGESAQSIESSKLSSPKKALAPKSGALQILGGSTDGNPVEEKIEGKPHGEIEGQPQEQETGDGGVKAS